MDHRRHRSCRASVEAAHARPEIGEKLVLVPGRRRWIAVVKRRGDPVIDRCARKTPAAPLCAHQVAWRMTRATMTDASGQIGAPIPLRALRRLRIVTPGPEEQ